MSVYLSLTVTRYLADVTDDDLLQKAQFGDPGAFEILVERYSSLLFRLISRMVHDDQLAHDVLQHVFLQLYRSLPTLVPGGKLKSWLSKVARNCAIDELRHRRELLFSEIELLPEGGEYSFLASIPDPERLPEEQAELCELRQKIVAAIEMLSPNIGAVVRLRYTTQMSFREIGQVLGIPEGTAKTYFYRAKKPLRVLLEPEFQYHDKDDQLMNERMPLAIVI